MIRKKILMILTVLMLVTPTKAFAKVINYEVQNNQGTVVTYNTDVLTESFLQFKGGEKAELYDRFAKDILDGKYVAFQDDSGKYVAYDNILKAFLKAKEEGKIFNLDEYMKIAPAISRESFAEHIDAVTGAPVDLKDSDLSPEDKKRAEEMLALQHGGKRDNDYAHEEKITEKKDEVKREEIKSETDEAIHYTREMIWNVMKSLAPNKLLPEGDDYREQVSKWFGEMSKSTSLDSRYYTLSTIKKLIAKKPEYNQKRQNKKEAEIFDLNNFMKFKGLSVKFDGLQNVEEHMGLGCISICEPKNTTSEKEFGDILHAEDVNSCKLVNGIDAYDATKYIYQCPWLNMAIWRPDIEKEIVQAVNELRQSKGLKPLEYSVDLHAMGRYSAKRNNFEISYDTSKGAGYGQGNLNRWLNKGLVGAESHCNPNCSDRQDYYSSYREARGQAYRNKELYKLMDKNSGKLFGYDKEIGYFAFAENRGMTGKGMVNMLEKRINGNAWNISSMESLQYLDRMPNLKEHILNPEMTKIGVGSIWNAPAGSIDRNGNTGVVIFTSK